MYNRYIPNQQGEAVELQPVTAQEHRAGILEQLLSQLGFGAQTGSSSGAGGLTALLGLDGGDILLLLILLYLLKESEDEDWLIILALMLIMGG